MMWTLLVLSLVIHGSYATTSGPQTTTETAIERFKQAVKGEVVRLWSVVDQDHDGHFNESDMEAIFQVYDTDHNRQISEHEFITHFGANNPNLTVVAQGLFLELDMDDDKSITKSDVRLYYQRIDSNDDGTVVESEFVNFFTEEMTLLFVLQYEASRTTPALPMIS